MKILVVGSLALALAAAPALAQTITTPPPAQPAAAAAPTDPSLEATESILVTEVNNHRNSEARAIGMTRLANALNAQVQDLSKKLGDADKALAAAQSDLKKASDTLAAQKAIQPPAPPDAAK